MLSVEPILERALWISGAVAVAGRAVVLEVLAVVVVAVEKVALGARGTMGFLSVTAPAVVEEELVFGAAVRVREAAVVAEAELRIAVVVVVVVLLGLLESATKVRRARGKTLSLKKKLKITYVFFGVWILFFGDCTYFLCKSQQVSRLLSFPLPKTLEFYIQFNGTFC